MNWEALAAIGQVASALAVGVTLIYLAIQIKHANVQSEIEAHRHTWDMLNQWCDLVSGSVETASIVVKGRASLQDLTQTEYLVFEHIHLRMLNTLESWHLQFAKTARDRKFKAQQMENLRSIAEGYFSHPGTRELWLRLREYFPTIADIVDSALAEE